MRALARGSSRQPRSQLSGRSSRWFDGLVQDVGRLVRGGHAVTDLLEAPLGVERTAFRDLDPMLQGGEGLQSLTGQPRAFLCL